MLLFHCRKTKTKLEYSFVTRVSPGGEDERPWEWIVQGEYVVNQQWYAMHQSEHIAKR